MLSNVGRRIFAPLLAWVSARLRHTGITPNALTLLGFGLTLLAAFILATGALRWGALLLLLASLFDMLDGALARAMGRSSKFGAFLDSTLDRYSESVTMLALVYYYAGQGDGRVQAVLVVAALVGSLMVSYTRARAEALNVECKVGLLQRPERVVLLIAGLLSGWMTPVLWGLALLANFTALQRIYQVHQRTHPVARARAIKKLAKSPRPASKHSIGD